MLDASLRSVLRRLHDGIDRFRDRLDGVDTATPLPKAAFENNSVNGRHAIQYLPSDRPLLRRMFRAFPYDPAEFKFIDIGCGRGRVVLEALRHGFRPVVGVEFEPTLADTAAKNVESFNRRVPHRDVEIFKGDIAEYEFGAENMFVFLYNPFHESMMRQLVERLEKWIVDHGGKHRLFVAYMNPVHGYLFQDSPQFREVASLRKLITVYPADGFPVVLFENG